MKYKMQILYLNMTSIVVLVQHDGLGVIIPKCPTKVLKLANPPHLCLHFLKWLYT